MSKERSHAGEAYNFRDATSSEPPVDSLLGGMQSGDWLDEQIFPEIKYTVPGIIPEGTTVFAGAPKVGKSWAVFHIGLSVAAGTHVFGCLHPGAPRPVLYLALEDGWRRLQGRARSLLPQGKGIPSKLNVLIEIKHGLAAETIAEWLEEHGTENPLVIIDTLGRVMPRAHAGESAYERDYRAVTQFKRLADAYPGSSIVIVHHTRKMGSDDFVDGVSGTLGITGAADTTLVLSRGRTENGGLMKVTGRDITEAEYSVDKADNGAWTLTGGSLDDARKSAATERVSEGVGDRSAEIIKLVADTPDGLGPTALAQKIGITPAAAGVYLKRLADAGRLARGGRGVYRSVDAVVLPFNTFNAFNRDTGDGEDSRPDSTVVTVEGVETPGQGPAVFNNVCQRCKHPSAHPLVAGRCREQCAYPTDNPDDPA